MIARRGHDSDSSSFAPLRDANSAATIGEIRREAVVHNAAYGD